jgi:hypothetical protein
MNAHDAIGRDGVAARWTKLSARRLDWAFDAYERFVDDLSEEMRERFAKGGVGGEAYVVVFGPTQVGKTTLILDLMGVAPQAMARVSNVLRGGRAFGCSATATAMEYRRSPDSTWRLRTNTSDASFSRDDEMTKALAEVRELMSARRLISDEPMIAWIPDECFDPGDDHNPRARMLDLPGVDPMEEAERAHVAEMARTYVGNADLIVLAGKADSLSFLCSEALDLPGVRDWRTVPERFRIVTTYSFTPQTVREIALSRTEPLDATFFRAELRREIATFGLRLNEDTEPERMFFPLEFGESWRRAADQHPDLFARVDPIVQALRKELRADIAESAAAYARLRSTAHVHETARRVKEERLKVWHARLDALRVRIDSVRHDAERLRRSHAAADAVVERMQKRVAAGEKALDPIAVRIDALSCMKRYGPIGAVTESRDEMLTCIRNFKAALVEAAIGILPSTEARATAFWTPLQSNETMRRDDIREAVSAAFEPLKRKFSKYWFDAYFGKSWGNFAEDKAALQAAASNAVEKAALKVREHWTHVISKRLEAIHGERQRAAGERDALSDSLDVLQADDDELQQSIRNVEAEMAAFSERMDREGQKGEQFRRLLDEHYATALRGRIGAIKAARTPTGALLALLSAVQVKDEKQRLLLEKR